jgi:hypothetical protein
MLTEEGGRGGGGARSYDAEIALSSINHSILSVPTIQNKFRPNIADTKLTDVVENADFFQITFAAGSFSDQINSLIKEKS